MGFKSIDQPSWSSEVEHNQKMSISFFWLERVADGVWVHQPAWLIIRSEHNPKRSISFYWLERAGRWTLSQLTSLADHQKLNVIKNWAFHFYGWRGVADEVQVHQSARPIIRREHNPKTSISFSWLERGGEWGLSPPTNPADHQKLNVIQKWVFHFIVWRGVMDGVWVHRPAWPIIRSEHNPKVSISFFWLEKGGRWGSSPSTRLADH